MSSLRWFDGNSKNALQQMVDKNSVFMVYIGKENDELRDVLKDVDIIELLNDDLVICFKMDPSSPSFDNFKVIFNDVAIPSIYLLEKNNIEQRVITIPKSTPSVNLKIALKRNLLSAISSTIKDILSNISTELHKQKILQYWENVQEKIEKMNKPVEKSEVPNILDNVKKSDNDMTKIKIKVPSKNITAIQEFQVTSTLNDVRVYVMTNMSLPSRQNKFIAHRQFVEEDFSTTLMDLDLCPSSTIYVHSAPSLVVSSVASIWGPWSLVLSIYHTVVLKPYYYIQDLVSSYVTTQPRVQPINAPRPPSRNPPNDNQQKKFTYKPMSNIHSLRNHYENRRQRPGDDDNSTYNGNSTQQL